MAFKWWDPAGILTKSWDISTTLYHKATGIPTEKEKRRERHQINDQIRAYKEQSNLAREQLNEVRAQKEAEKRRVNEKQIRALRGTYRSRGLLGGQVTPTEEGMSTKLGG